MTADRARGRLDWAPVLTRIDLVAEPVRATIAAWPDGADDVLVAAIDPGLADTAAFCDTYEVALDASANCVIVAGKRGGDVRMAACVVLATTRADVNGLVRRHIDARKASFAPMDAAVAETGMEYGGITPIGLPPQWPLLVDAGVIEAGDVVIGSGLRRSKLLLPGARLAELPAAEVLDGLGVPVQ